MKIFDVVVAPEDNHQFLTYYRIKTNIIPNDEFIKGFVSTSYKVLVIYDTGNFVDIIYEPIESYIKDNS